MIDTDVLIRHLRSRADIHSLMIPSSHQNIMMPSPDYDETASRVLKALADGLMMATDNTVQHI